MNKRRKKKKRGCVVPVIIALVVVVCVALFVFTDLFSQIRLSIEHQIYPLKYEQEILAAAEENNLKPELLCAVIYAESKFNEKATSSVGARGLMQIMPETFTWLTSDSHKEYTADDLYDPLINIEYGAEYLGDLYAHFGDIYTACAAYNAGSGTVEQWLGSDEYSEDGVTLTYIPYGETSGYVENIKNYSLKYKELYFENNQY